VILLDLVSLLYFQHIIHTDPIKDYSSENEPA